MKYFLGIILAFALILPSKSLAGDFSHSNETPDLPEFLIGGGYKIFSAGFDLGLKILFFCTSLAYAMYFGLRISLLRQWDLKLDGNQKQDLSMELPFYLPNLLFHISKF